MATISRNMNYKSPKLFARQVKSDFGTLFVIATKVNNYVQYKKRIKYL